jgi:uncharacterized integral membrane protein
VLKNPKFLLASFLLLIILILILQNTEVVEVRFLFWGARMSRVVVILLAALSGFAAGFLAAKLGVGKRRTAA